MHCQVLIRIEGLVQALHASGWSTCIELRENLQVGTMTLHLALYVSCGFVVAFKT